MRKMQRTKGKTHFFRNFIALVLIFAGSALASFFYFQPHFAFKSSFIEEIESQRRRAKLREDKKVSSRLYQIPAADSSGSNKKVVLLASLEDTITKYMQPYNVTLLDVYVDKDGSVYVDLSDEIRKNFNGDVFEEYQILAGLYKSVRGHVPYLRSLKVLIEGREADSFGGHIDISKPIGETIEQPSGEKIENTI